MENKSIFGPSLYRFTAILMVIGANALYLFQWHLPVISQFAPIIGYLGLESFFVLSGFWLAQKLYPLYLSDHFGWNNAFDFIKKRLCRILPLYWIVLLLNIGLAIQMHYGLPEIWKYFFLLQNFATPIPAFFPESWGLAVIVFALILLPLLLAGIPGVITKDQKKFVFPTVAIAVLLLFLWARWIFNETHQNLSIDDWETKIRTVVLYRIDAVAYGVLAGWLTQVISIRRVKWLFATVALLGFLFLAIGVGYFQITIEQYPFFWNVLYLPITDLALVCAMLLVAKWQWSGKVAAVINAVGRAVYAIYLVHFSIVLLLMEHYLFSDLPQFSILTVVLFAILYMVLCIVLGLLIFRWVEKPLRNRLNC